MIINVKLFINKQDHAKLMKLFGKDYRENKLKEKFQEALDKMLIGIARMEQNV